MMPVVLLGCIYSGITTPTEAAALAAAYALVGLGDCLPKCDLAVALYASLLSSARTTASIGMLIAGALVFNYVVTVENIPSYDPGDASRARSLSPGFHAACQRTVINPRVPLEGTTIILIVLPVLIPTAEALGIDLVYFGVVAVVNIMLGLITPPYGLLLFIMANISGRPAEGDRERYHAFSFAMIVCAGVYNTRA